MGTRQTRRTEWLALMTELASVDRAAYRKLRAEAWARVACSHKEQTAEQRQAWLDLSS